MQIALNGQFGDIVYIKDSYTKGEKLIACQVEIHFDRKFENDINSKHRPPIKNLRIYQHN